MILKWSVHPQSSINVLYLFMLTCDQQLSLFTVWLRLKQRQIIYNANAQTWKWHVVVSCLSMVQWSFNRRGLCSIEKHCMGVRSHWPACCMGPQCTRCMMMLPTIYSVYDDAFWFVLFNDTWSQVQVQISRSDIRPHIKWAVSLVILHMLNSIFLRALCGYIWVNILTLSPRGDIMY